MDKEAKRQADLEALRRFGKDAQELERIEILSLSRFNIFEAIGFGKQETMHSRFLAFFLDPKQNHKLGHLFLKSFLQKVSEHAMEEPLAAIFASIVGRKLDQTTVRTEVSACLYLF